MPSPFRKSKTSNVDIDRAIKKLKSLYRTYAETYGEKTFNYRGFESRYREALLKKIDLPVFINAEISVFEELRHRVEINDTSGEASYSDVADRIIEENLEKIQGYRKIDFHPDAEEEAKYLLGSVTDFYYGTWNEVQRLLRDLGVKAISDTLFELENDFTYFVVPVRGLYSRAVDDYMRVLGRKMPRESERASYNFIKNGGILLNNCMRVINDGVNCMSDTADNEALSALIKHREELKRIIENFRFNDIRGY
jgi:hypothetical protein